MHYSDTFLSQPALHFYRFELLSSAHLLDQTQWSAFAPCVHQWALTVHDTVAGSSVAGQWVIRVLVIFYTLCTWHWSVSLYKFLVWHFVAESLCFLNVRCEICGIFRREKFHKCTCCNGDIRCSAILKFSELYRMTYSKRWIPWKHLNSKIKWYDPVLTETNYKNILQFQIVAITFFVSVIKNIEEVLKLFHNVLTM